MSDEKKKADPFQLITLIIIVGSVFLGLYYTNLSVGARFDSVETAIAGNGATMETIIDRLDAKVANLQKEVETEPAAAGEPAAEPAADEEGAAADEAEGDKAAEPAKDDEEEAAE